MASMTPVASGVSQRLAWARHKADRSRKSFVVQRGSAMLLVAALVAGCSGTPDYEEQNFEARVGAVSAEIGDASTGLVRVPDDAFPEGTQLTVMVGVDAPDPGDAFTPIGPAMSVTVDGGHRPDELVELLLTFDPDEASEPGEVVVAYYHQGRGWVLLDADDIDLSNGSVQIATDHFSPWWAGRITTTQRVERYVEQRATTEFVRSRSVDASAAQIEAAVAEIMRDGVGVADNRVIEIVAKAVIAQAPGGSIALALGNADPEAFTQSMLSETASVLGSMVMDEGSPVATALGSVGAVSSALGAVAGGDTREASRVIGLHIGGLVGAGRLIAIGQAAAEAVDHVVNDLWLDPSVNKAYEVYRDGADGLFGYSVPPRDFDAVLEQMSPGVIRQLRINYIAAQAAVLGVDPSELSQQERLALGDEAEQKLRERFDDRIDREPELAARKQAITTLFDDFNNRGMFTTTDVNPLIAEGADVTQEMLMDRIMAFSARVQRDTGRLTLASSDAFAARHDDGTQIPTYVIAAAALAWFTSPADERQQAYLDVLIEEGMLEPLPDPADERERDIAEFAALACPAFRNWEGVFDNELISELAANEDPRWVARERALEAMAELSDKHGNFAVEQALYGNCPDVLE